MNKELEWAIGGDTGLSSMVIFRTMTKSSPAPRADVPFDAGDFGRCERLLERFPEWRDRMHEVAEAHEEWTQLVEHWDRLVEMYHAGKPMGEELARLTGQAWTIR